MTLRLAIDDDHLGRSVLGLGLTVGGWLISAV